MEVSEILERVDILDYISQYCDFEEEGGEYWALSPFTNEKTPSFSVNIEKQKFYDFSSGQGGNLLSFIQVYDNCDFFTALGKVKKYAKIEDGRETSSKRLNCARIAKKFRQSPMQMLVQDTSPLPENFMDRYEFNRKKLKPWIDEGISEKTLREFGVKYDQVSNRIVFPIRDYAGRLVNISGRTLDPDYKEKRIAKYIYMKSKGRLNTIYGFSKNREVIEDCGSIILFEGAKSVMLASQWGIRNTGAILTSHISEQQFLFLAKLGVRTIFALDKGIDITKDKNVQKLKHYVSVEYIVDKSSVLLDKMSPVDAGKDVFFQLLKERRSLR